MIAERLRTRTPKQVMHYIRTNEVQTYFVPTPLAAMLMTILLSPQIGLVVSFLLALFIGSLFGDFYVALICALTSAVAVYSVPLVSPVVGVLQNRARECRT